MTTSVGAPAVQLIGLTRRFGDVLAVDDLDLTIQQGEVVALLGPNGAGKTTTIDAILGLGPQIDDPRHGEGDVRVFGLAPGQAVARGLVGAVLQSGGLLPELTVRDTVELIASAFDRTFAVDDAMARAGITELARRRVQKCSGGEQQRLRFAMALVSDPALLILDEPTTGMDVEVRRRFWSAIHADAQAGRTVLFATHYLEEAEQYADRIVLMARGRIVADGTVAQIRAGVGGRTVRGTLGAPTSPTAPRASRAADARMPGAPTRHHLVPDPAAGIRAALDHLPVESLEVRGNTLLVTTTDSDAVAQVLLRERLAHDLEISARGLDDAFLALTREDAHR